MGKKDGRKNQQGSETKKQYEGSKLKQGKGSVDDKRETKASENKAKDKISFSAAERRVRKVAPQPNRYEEDVLTTEDLDLALSSVEPIDLKRGIDFSEYLDQTQTHSSQFRLEEEKIWDRETLDLQGEYFSLNLQALASDLAKLPLLQRLRIDRDFFSSEHLKVLDQSPEPLKPNVQPSAVAEFIISTLRENRVAEEAKCENLLEDELDRLLTVTSPAPADDDSPPTFEDPLISAVDEFVVPANDTPVPVSAADDNDWLEELLNS